MADQDPWEIDYAKPALSGATTGYTVKGLEGTEPKIELRPVGQRAPASTNTQTATLDPWEVTYQKPKAPAQPSPIERAGKAFYEGSGLSALVDLASGDDERVKRVLTGTAQGIAAEPGRVWGELTNLGQSMIKGDFPGMAYHAAGAVPMLGAPAQQIAQDVQRGDYASAVGHTGGLVAPMLLGPAGEAASTGATFAKGAIPAAIKAGVKRPPYGAALIGELIGGPKGAAIAATIAKTPGVISAGVRGGRAALGTRAAAIADQLAAEEAAAATARQVADAALARQAQVYEAHEAMTQPSGQLQLGPGPARILQMPPITEEPPVPAPVNVPLRRTPAGQLAPASSYQMPPAGTAAEEARIQRLQPETVIPEAAPTPAAAPAVTMETLAPALTDGKPLSKLTKTERAQVQAVYDRIQHPLEVSEPTAAERAIITPASEAAATLEYNAPQAQTEPPPPRGKTAAELLQEEIAAKRAAAAAETPAVPLAQQTPAEAQAAFEQAKATKTIPVESGATPAQAKADFEARQKPKQEEPAPAAATPAAAPQNLSDLMAGELPKIEQPGRSMYTATGELKSARLRGQEIKLANIEAKAQRFSNALTAFGMDPADVAKVKEGWVTAEAMKAGSPPGWENVMHDLIAKGLLDKAEKRAPSESVPRIVELMQQQQIAQAPKPAAPQNLSELMKPPKPAPAAPKKPARKTRRTPPER